ncbi:CLUMA_CG000477, isoform A [Clunio marinus]|uniref:CLUMA_CG000477, isoform A n=1 Tax=Clunio marinus TaxID=568069 RepID=A0A1J1HK69_9DIPT|nr:CLUMA_CG000477, isoform A [Clunio marinus]
MPEIIKKESKKKRRKASAKYLYDYYGNLSEVAAVESTSLPQLNHIQKPKEIIRSKTMEEKF